MAQVQLHANARRAYLVIEMAYDSPDLADPVYVVDFQNFPDAALAGEISRTVDEIDASSFIDGAFRRQVVGGRETVRATLAGAATVTRFASLDAYEARPDGDLRRVIREQRGQLDRLRHLVNLAVDALNRWPRKCRRHPMHVGPGCRRCARILAANLVRERVESWRRSRAEGVNW